MKNLVFITLSIFLFFACTEASKNTAVVETPNAALSDSAAIANTIHGFFKWYGALTIDTTKRVLFAEDNGKHFQLNQSKLETYYAHFKESGFVSTEFIENEYAFYKKCHVLWQNEPSNEVPSCLDGDKYFCAQEWREEIWTTKPVKIKNIGTDRVLATLSAKDYDSLIVRHFELKKENGKWLLTKIECDMGVK